LRPFYLQEKTLNQGTLNAGFLFSLLFRPWWWRRYVPPKRRLTFNGLHGVISQKMVLTITLLNSSTCRRPAQCHNECRMNWIRSSTETSSRHTYQEQRSTRLYHLTQWMSMDQQQPDSILYCSIPVLHERRLHSLCWRSGGYQMDLHTEWMY
jgi:hypothetical protein